MRIMTIAKRVPDSRVTPQIRPDGSGIDTAGLRYVCDPFDEFGIEQAVRLKESRTDVQEVCVLSVGGNEVVEILRSAIAMGADRAVHLYAEELPLHDELAMAEGLAAAIRNHPPMPDLVLCGKQNIDNDAGELGPALAEHLGLPHIGAVTRLEIDADGSLLRAWRRIEGAEEILESSFPVLLTCDKGLVEPRHPALPKLMKAKKHPVETIPIAALMDGNLPSAGPVFERLTPPPSRQTCRFIDGEPKEMARHLIRLLREEAKVI